MLSEQGKSIERHSSSGCASSATPKGKEKQSRGPTQSPATPKPIPTSGRKKSGCRQQAYDDDLGGFEAPSIGRRARRYERYMSPIFTQAEIKTFLDMA